MHEETFVNFRKKGVNFRKKVANFIKNVVNFMVVKNDSCKFHPDFTSNMSIRFDPDVPSLHFAFFYFFKENLIIYFLKNTISLTTNKQDI